MLHAVGARDPRAPPSRACSGAESGARSTLYANAHCAGLRPCSWSGPDFADSVQFGSSSVASSSLTTRHVGWHAVQQVRGGLTGAACATRAANAACLAGECNEHRRSARGARSMRETTSEDSAVQETSQLVLHVAGKPAMTGLRGHHQERREPSVGDLPTHGIWGLRSLVTRAASRSRAPRRARTSERVCCSLRGGMTGLNEKAADVTRSRGRCCVSKAPSGPWSVAGAHTASLSSSPRGHGGC